MGLRTLVADWIKARRAPASLFPEGGIGRGLLAGLTAGAMGEPPARGVQQQLDAYTLMPWLRAVAEKVAQSIAAVEWELYVLAEQPRKPATGRRRALPPQPGDRFVRDKALQRADLIHRKADLHERRDAGELREITDHPFLDALDRPNRFHTGLQLRKLTQTHLDLVGESFWLKERNGVGAPIGFWPLAPSWVLSTPALTRPVYRISVRGFQAEIPESEILWLNNPNPAAPYGRGTGIGQALANELETDDYAAKFTRSLFYNGARPDFLVWPKGDAQLRDAEVRRLEQDWLNRHEGVYRAGRPKFLSGEIGVYEFTRNLQQMQFNDLRAFERDTIIQVFGGVPPELMGVLESSNRATIDSAGYLFAEHVLVPRLELLRSIFQERLIPEYDERLILDYISPVKEDLLQQNEIMRTHAWAFTVDEIRARGGENPLNDSNDGDAHAVWLNMTFQRNLVPEGDTGAAFVQPAEVPTPGQVGLPDRDVGNTGNPEPSGRPPSNPSQPETSPE